MKLNTIITYFVTIIIAGIGGFIPIYKEFTTPSPKLYASVQSNIFYTPSQYDSLMKKTLEESDWNKLYSLINPVTTEISFDEKKKLVEQLQKKILMPWSAPFNHGLNKYQGLLFILIENDGDAIAKNVYIDFPETVLLDIEDDKKETSSSNGPIKRYTIPSIRQKGQYKIWIWTQNSSLNKYDIKIGSDDQITNIEYYEKYSGIASLLASNYITVIVLIVLLFSIYIYSVYTALYPLPKQQKKE